MKWLVKGMRLGRVTPVNLVPPMEASCGDQEDYIDTCDFSVTVCKLDAT